MNRTFASWPALNVEGKASRVAYDQAIWGKVRGSDADFGWIARSPGFSSGEPPIESCLKLGSEDQLVSSSFWKVTRSHCYAIRAYASPDVDSTGQRGLEKRFLSCEKGSMPVAAIAAALLIDSAQLADGQASSESGLAIEARQSSPLATATVDLNPRVKAVIDVGIEQVRKAIDSPDALADFYWRILGGVRPAVLRSDAPLAPEAIAALLLPLERSLADTLSIAGWIPSTRYNLEDIRSAWDAVVCETIPAAFIATVPDRALWPSAELLAKKLLDIQASPPDTIVEASPVAAGPEVPVERRVGARRPDIEILLEFARSRERYRAVREPRPMYVDEEMRQELAQALNRIREELYEDDYQNDGLFEARRRHLQLKADRIKALALKIHPSFDSLNWTIE